MELKKCLAKHLIKLVSKTIIFIKSKNIKKLC